MFFLSLPAIMIFLGEIFFGEKFLLILYAVFRGLEQNINIRNLSFKNSQNEISIKAICLQHLCL